VLGAGMNKLLKYGLLGVGGMVGLFVIFLVVIAFTVEPNSFKPQIVNLVQEKKQRTLTLEGDIKLTFFPRLGLDLGKTRLSEHKSAKDFASLDSVQLYVAWLPLLYKELVIRKVRVEGARVNLVRNADGTTNFDDLISKDKSKQIKFDIDGVKVSRSALRFDDRMTKRKWDISDLEMSSGRIKDNTHTHVALDFKLAGDNPQLATHIVLKSGLLFALEEQHYALDGVDLKASGVADGISQLDLLARGDVDVKVKTQEITLKDCKITLKGNRATDKLDIALDAPKLMLTEKKAEGTKLTLAAKVERQNGKLAATFTLPDLSGSPQQFQVSQLSVDVDGKQGDNHIKGKLTSPLTGSLAAQTVNLPTIRANFDVANPRLSKGGIKLALNGDARADLIKQQAAAVFMAKLDDSAIQTKLGMNQFAHPRINFDIVIDQLNVDRYLPPGAKTKQPEPASPMDLSDLKAIDASGSVRIGQLKVASLKSSNVRLDVKADPGQFPLQQNLSGISSAARSRN